MKKDKNKKWSLFSYLLLIPLFLLFVLFIGAAFPEISNYQIKVVLSRSMEPEIKVGSIIVVSPGEEYEIGDVITFNIDKKADIPTTHRIKDIKVVSGESIYITQGDANFIEDMGEVQKDDVIGRVRLTVPLVGYFLKFVGSKIGFVFVVIGPAILIIFNEIRKIIQEIKKKKKKVEINA